MKTTLWTMAAILTMAMSSKNVLAQTLTMAKTDTVSIAKIDSLYLAFKSGKLPGLTGLILIYAQPETLATVNAAPDSAHKQNLLQKAGTAGKEKVLDEAKKKLGKFNPFSKKPKN